MVATSRSTPQPVSGTAGPTGEASGSAEPEAQLSAVGAAKRVARLFPEVYRRYHWAQRVQGAELPVTRRGLEVLQHLATSGPLTVGEQA
jgi:hypothetical protein